MRYGEIKCYGDHCDWQREMVGRLRSAVERDGRSPVRLAPDDSGAVVQYRSVAQVAVDGRSSSVRSVGGTTQPMTSRMVSPTAARKAGSRSLGVTFGPPRSDGTVARYTPMTRSNPAARRKFESSARDALDFAAQNTERMRRRALLERNAELVARLTGGV
jgi:hypothetical protein